MRKCLDGFFVRLYDFMLYMGFVVEQYLFIFIILVALIQIIYCLY